MAAIDDPRRADGEVADAPETTVATAGRAELVRGARTAVRRPGEFRVLRGQAAEPKAGFLDTRWSRPLDSLSHGCDGA